MWLLHLRFINRHRVFCNSERWPFHSMPGTPMIQRDTHETNRTQDPPGQSHPACRTLGEWVRQ